MRPRAGWMNFSSLVAPVVASCTSSLCAQPTRHRAIVDLGTLGGTWSRPYDINASLGVVGASQLAGGDTFHGYIWTWLEGMRDIGTFGGNNSKCRGINDGGVVAGWAGTEADAFHAFIFIGEGKKEDLGTLGGSLSKARAINNREQVVGFAHTLAEQPHAFIWERATGMRDLGTLGGDTSESRAINEIGSVAGYADTPDQQQKAFFWSEMTGMINCGTFGGAKSWAYGLNDLDQVVGDAQNADNRDRAFIWDSQIGLRDLGDFGGPTSNARGINNRGQVVGNSENYNGRPVAFLWEQGRWLQDLNELLPPRSGWYLAAAIAINEDGYIAGIGAIGGEQHTFVLSPEFVLHSGVPGAAGQLNTFTVSGAGPGSTVSFYYSLNIAQSDAPGCPGLFLSLQHARLAGSDLAEDGSASISLMVPARAAGKKVYMQAVEQDFCRISNVKGTQF